MQDQVSRLVGLDGFVVKGVVEVGGQLDLQVELVAREKACRHCGAASWRSRTVRGCGCAICRRRAGGRVAASTHSPRSSTSCGSADDPDRWESC